ncbi:MAG TPA: hypothetical protein VEL76_33650 [Gemmataceae bacterium]|nr:hypothetical protein [Gemmataceae bacterium]
MEISNFKMHRRAVWAFRELDADEQAQVRARLALFSEIPLAQWPPALVKRLPGEEPIYLLRINESLRAFIRAAEGQQPEVLDFAAQAWLDFLAKADAGAGK